MYVCTISHVFTYYYSIVCFAWMYSCVLLLALIKPSSCSLISLFRPVPLSRKRRFSGRLSSRVSHSISEGDMAMADEMGEGEGGGDDDGFVDCVGGEAVKRRNKKRGG